MIPSATRFAADCLERVVATALVAFATVELSGDAIFSVSTVHAAEIAGIAAGMTALKTILAGLIGSSGTASLLPSKLTPGETAAIGYVEDTVLPELEKVITRDGYGVAPVTTAPGYVSTPVVKVQQTPGITVPI